MLKISIVLPNILDADKNDYGNLQVVVSFREGHWKKKPSLLREKRLDILSLAH